MSSISLARLAGLGLVAALVAGRADAQPGSDATGNRTTEGALAEARRLYAEGEAHYGAGRYPLAAEAFVKAYELSGKPELLFNLANTYERAGDYQKAAKYMRMYLDGGSVHDPVAVRARLQRLEAAAIEQQKRAPEAAKPAPVPEKPTPVRRRGASKVPYYAAGAGAVIGAGVAVTFGLRARDARSQLDAMCTERDGGLLCPEDAGPYLDDERRNALISDIGIGVAALSVATGAVYYVLTARGDGDPGDAARPSVSIVPAAGAGSVGITAIASF
jgi:tetratricopeptide (TPR) repeat protein